MKQHSASINFSENLNLPINFFHTQVLRLFKPAFSFVNVLSQKLENILLPQVKKFSLFLLLIFIGFTTFAQTSTEWFETESNGSTSFTDNGVIFNITSTAGFAVKNNVDKGWNGTANENSFIDNAGSTALGASFSIKTTSNLFKTNRFWVFVSDAALNQTVSGSLTVTGKLSGVTKYAQTKSTGFTALTSTTNGYTLIDLTNLNGQNYSNIIIDELQITLGEAYTYVRFDAFTWVKDTGLVVVPTTISPAFGTTAGATVVTITGSNFTGATAVTFGGVAGTGLMVNSSTSITVTTPAGTVGVKDVVVTTSSGSVTSTGGYTYISPSLSAPVFDEAPAVSNVQSSKLDLSVSMDKAGRLYYAIFPDGATAPTVAQVKAGVGSPGSVATHSGSKGIFLSPFSLSFTILNLVPGTAYDIYVVAEDDASPANLMASPVKLDVTTSFNTTPTIVNLNNEFVAWSGEGNSVTLDYGGDATITDTELDASNWGGASLTVQRMNTPLVSDIFSFNASGYSVNGGNLQTGSSTTFGTFSNTNGLLTISFNANATNTLVRDVVRGIQYRNDTPAGDATIRFTLSDGNSSTTADVTVSSDVIYITNSTDAATIDLSNGVSFSEAIAIAAADVTGSQTIVFNAPAAYNINNVAINESLTFDMDRANGMSLTGGTITLNSGTLTLTNGTGDIATISSAIAGMGALGKTGLGTLSLAGSNSYNSTTLVLGGTLSVTGDGNLGSGAITLTAGTTLAINGATTIDNVIVLTGAATVNNTANVTLDGVISGAYNLTKTGSGILTLSRDNTYAATNVNAGILSVSSDSNLGSGAIALAAGTTLAITGTTTIDNAIALVGAATINNTANATIGGVISGAHNLTKTGSATLTLSGTNTYSGNTIVSAGGLTLTGGSSIGDASAVLVASGATLTLDGGSETIGSLLGDGNMVLGYNLTTGGNNASTTFSGVISGAGNGITKTGSGTFTLSGSNTYTGSTTVSAGTLALNGGAAIHDASAVTVSSGAMLSLNASETVGSLAGAGNVSLNSFTLSSGGNNTSTTFSGQLSSGGGFIKTGNGTLTLSGTNSSTFIGSTSVLGGGTLSVTNDGNLGTGVLIINNSTFSITSPTTIDNIIVLTNSATINNALAVTLSGTISGSGSLTKVGSAVLSLSGTNIYGGSTTVSAGTLAVNGALNGTSAVSVNSGATLTGSGSIANLVVSNGGTLSPGDGVGTFTVNGNLQMNSGSTLAVNINGVTAGTDYDQVIVNGTASLAGTLLVNHGYTAGDGDSYTIIANDAADAITGTFSGLAEGGTVTAGGNGTVLTASYISGTGNDFTLTAPINAAPVISGTPATSVNQDANYSFTPTASDVDVNDVLTFSIINKPSWASFNAATGSLTGTPTNANVGVTTGIVITVSDGALSASLPAFNLTVVNVNDAPIISGAPAISVSQDANYSFIPTASDIDVNDMLIFSITNKPSWANFNTTTGALTGTPTNANVGTTTGIVISVSDGISTVNLPAFNLEVTTLIFTGISLSNESFIYDGSAKSLAITGALPTGTSVIYANNSRTDIGTQTVEATVSGTGYTPLVLTADLTVTPAIITGITLVSNKFVYDGIAKSLVITGTLPSETTVNYSNNTQTNVGTQVVTVTISGANYTNLVLSADLTVDPKAINVIVDPKRKNFGAADPALTYTINPALVAGDRFRGNLIRTAGERVGIYAISQGSLTAGANYTITFSPANFTIAASILNVVAQANTKVYGETDPVFTYTVSGLAPGEVLTGKLQRVAGENAGTYLIGIGDLSAGTNYQINYTSSNFIIGKAHLTVSANSAEMCQGSKLPVFSLSYSGFKNGDTESSLNTKPDVTTTANSSSAAGTYPIAANGGFANNYEMTYVNGTLTVKAIPVIAITSDKGLSVAKGEILTLTATGGTTYLWANASGIVSGQGTAVLTIRPTVNTTYTVTATNATGCSTTQSITIQVSEETVAIKPTNIMSPNGDGVNDKWVIENLDLYPNNEVTVVDRAGRAVYSKKGYDNSWDATLRGIPLAEGTYYYIIVYGADKQVKKGFITILNKK